MPRIQHKRGTSANLASVNPTPLAGELVWDSTENAIKIGDGATAWTSLAYVTATPRSHVHDGADITTGTVAYARLPVGSTTSTVCAGDDSRLTDARPPTAHKATHATGGSDALTPADIGAAPAASPVFSGNVGIGVNPAGSFNSSFDDLVVGTGTGNRGITINTDSSSQATVAFADGTSGAAAYAGAIQYSHSTDTLAFWTASASRVTIGSTGVITVAAGTAAAPAIVASGDSNTGLLWPAADTFAISTAGSERLRVDSSGNIEAGPNKRTIGVSSRMHISADNANWGTPLCVVCDSVGRGPVVVSADYSPNPDVGSQLYFNASTGGFTIGCSSPGNSALGSVTFSASQIVTPAGTAAAPAIVSTTGTADSGVYWPAADTFAISTAGVERLRVRADGILGIGNAGFANTAFALGNSTSSTGATHVGLYSAPTFNSAGTSLFNFYSEPQTAGSAVTLLVGFTAAPHLGGGTVTTAVGFRVSTSFTSGSTNYGFQSSIASGSNRWNAYFDGTAPNYFVGNVGIGSGTTSPTAALDINSDKIRLRTAKTPASASDTGNAGDICWDASYLYICTATNTWRRIAHSTW